MPHLHEAACAGSAEPALCSMCEQAAAWCEPPCTLQHGVQQKCRQAPCLPSTPTNTPIYSAEVHGHYFTHACGLPCVAWQTTPGGTLAPRPVPNPTTPCWEASVHHGTSYVGKTAWQHVHACSSCTYEGMPAHVAFDPSAATSQQPAVHVFFFAIQL